MNLSGLFRGRKFTSAMLAALLAALNDTLNLGIKPDTVLLIAGLVGVFILGESAADAAGAMGEKWGAKSNGNGKPPAPPPPAAPPTP